MLKFSDSIFQKNPILSRTLLGGTVGAGLGYGGTHLHGYLNPNAYSSPEEKEQLARNRAKAFGLSGGLLGAELGLAAHADQEWQKAHDAFDAEHAAWEASQKAREEARRKAWEDTQQKWKDYHSNPHAYDDGETWWQNFSAKDSSGKKGYQPPPRSSYTPPPRGTGTTPNDAWRSTFSNLYDESRHGKPLGKMWQAVLGSSELNDPARRAAVEQFMKHVGTAGANATHLETLMNSVPGDTAVGQLMRVLFNKHHAKTASLLKQAAYFETLAMYGLFG